ncbi:MAG: glycosyltransferase [Bacillota bacterium]
MITCHNYGRYLEKCIGSVLHQTYANCEVIVINDGRRLCPSC